MNELLQQSILDAFSEIQKWNQQFIIDDAGNSVDLASATLGQQSTTPLLASNQPTTFPHRSVYRFDATRYKGMDSFSSLVLMIQNSLPGAPFSFVRGSQRNRFVLCCSHHRLRQKKVMEQTHVFAEGNFTQNGVKKEYIKRRKSKSGFASIDSMAGKQESRLIKSSMATKYKPYSTNQPTNRRVSSIRKSNKQDRCNCKVAFFLWPDGSFYLDHTTTNLVHNGHPEYNPQAKLKGLRYISDHSKLLIERMSAVGVRPSQLSVMLEMLDESEGTFHTSTVKNLIHQCELFHQKELGIDHNMSTAEKAMEFLNR